MAKVIKSPQRDKRAAQSRLRDTAISLSRMLREARQRQQLSQQALARKLGLRQRQISDLERAATDSRLSTIQNVARALDLELTLIPRHLIAVIEALLRTGGTTAKRPLYALDDEPEDTAAATEHVEAGDTSNSRSDRNPQPRVRRGARR